MEILLTFDKSVCDQKEQSCIQCHHRPTAFHRSSSRWHPCALWSNAQFAAPLKSLPQILFADTVDESGSHTGRLSYYSQEELWWKMLLRQFQYVHAIHSIKE